MLQLTGKSLAVRFQPVVTEWWTSHSPGVQSRPPPESLSDQEEPVEIVHNQISEFLTWPMFVTFKFPK